MLRDGTIHILEFRSRSGTFWFVCASSANKQDRVNILAADNTFPGICTDCKLMYYNMYQLDLEDGIVAARSGHNRVKKYGFIDSFRKNLIEPKIKFNI